MALSFIVCQTRKTEVDVKDASTKTATRTKMTASLEFLVRAVDDVSGDPVAPDTVSDNMAIEATGLPTVNGTSFFDAAAGESRPYMLCKSKSCKRDQANGSVFFVTAKYEEIIDGRENPSQPCPNDLTDITPQVEAKIGTSQRVIYEDFSAPDTKDCARLPVVGEKFNAPVTTDDPVLTLTIKQYVASMTFNEMMYQQNLVNSTTYRGMPAGRWKIVGVRPKEVQVTLCSGEVDAVLVEYDIELSVYSVGNYQTGGGENGTPYKTEFVGHDTAMPLISKFFNDGSGKTAFADAATGYGSVGFILEDGNVNPNDDRPNYMIFKTCRRGPFTFLQA